MEPIAQAAQIPDAVYVILGTLLVTNFGTIVAIYHKKKDQEKEQKKEEISIAVERAVIQKSLENLTILYGKLDKRMDDIQKDFDNAYGKWRSEKESS